MAEKVYICNMVQSWPVERQQASLAGLIEKHTLYRDHLSQAARRDRRLSALRDRDAMLKSIRPGQDDAVHVAALACLIFDLDDLIRVTAEGERRGFAIIAHDIGLTIQPGAGAGAIEHAKVVLNFGRRAAGAGKGREEAAKRKIEDTLRRIELARPHWHLTEKLTNEIRQIAAHNGRPMAYATLKAHLGDRVKAQDEYERKMALEASRAAARERKKKGAEA